MTEQALQLDFGKVILMDNILVAELNEGILFDVNNNRKLLEIGKEKFNGKPYGYISNRLNSYAVNPMVYLESANVSMLKAIAVVTTDPICKQNALIERQFYKESNCFNVFENLEDAIKWMKEII